MIRKIQKFDPIMSSWEIIYFTGLSSKKRKKKKKTDVSLLNDALSQKEQPEAAKRKRKMKEY